MIGGFKYWTVGLRALFLLWPGLSYRLLFDIARPPYKDTLLAFLKFVRTSLL